MNKPLDLDEDEADRQRAAIMDERERCALLNEALADIHQKSADKFRVLGRYTTRAIWPLFKKVTCVLPGHERAARDIENVVRSLRTVAECIRKGYDPRDKQRADELEKLRPCIGCDNSCGSPASCDRLRRPWEDPTDADGRV